MATAAVVTIAVVGWLLDADNGSLPEWVEAISTGAAFLIAAVALRQELGDRHEERERVALERARRIGLRVGGSGINQEHWDLELTYANESEDFVYELNFEAVDVNGTVLGRDTLQDLAPGERLQRKVRIPWLEFRDVRWTLRWRDAVGATWTRTHRNEIVKGETVTEGAARGQERR